MLTELKLKLLPCLITSFQFVRRSFCILRRSTDSFLRWNGLWTLMKIAIPTIWQPRDPQSDDCFKFVSIYVFNRSILFILFIILFISFRMVLRSRSRIIPPFCRFYPLFGLPAMVTHLFFPIFVGFFSSSSRLLPAARLIEPVSNWCSTIITSKKQRPTKIKCKTTQNIKPHGAFLSVPLTRLLCSAVFMIFGSIFCLFLTMS